MKNEGSKRKRVVVDVLLTGRADSKLPEAEAEPTVIEQQKTELSVENTNANDEGQIQGDVEGENIEFNKLKPETKCITESGDHVVCENGANSVQNDPGSLISSTELRPNEVPNQEIQDKNDETSSGESIVQEEISEERAESAENGVVENQADRKSSDIEKTESEVESQKESQANSSENSSTTEEDGQKDQTSKIEKRYIICEIFGFHVVSSGLVCS